MKERLKGRFTPGSKLVSMELYTGSEPVETVKGEPVDIEDYVRGDPPPAPQMGCADIGPWTNVRTWVCDGQTMIYKPLQIEGPFACGADWKTYVQCDGKTYTLKG